MRRLATLALLATIQAACVGAPQASAAAGATERAPPPPAGLAVATFAGGCFWCMEPPFDEREGVVSTTSGYTGGAVAAPSYEQVSAGRTGHAEAVRVVYDPQRVGYAELLDVFWRNVDPLVADRQFCDVGSQYRPAIYAHDEEQRRRAEQSKRELAASGRFARPIVVEIADAGPFWIAEEYHQDYAEKNPLRYKLYRTGCGRDRRLDQLWSEPPP
ncbi:MAG TPA: peptide-methionine (S)-S-oxide reductase MsrA [Thermoanaerobaculia bacterium]|nr:peptide-methionine (S)-S-oxide reductase MsrA [Thermoanaerobaculia bacterium]